MDVVATAGHVDHGKSTLIRALTGIEPDRWAEERRRGLTIDLGFAWTTLPSGRDVAFVDVPGHERFLGNMLAGLGPAPVVLFVVALDEGWRAQSSDHRDAVAALGIDRGLIVLSCADRAPDRVDEVLAQVRSELSETGLRDAPAVVVSATQGVGLSELRIALDDVLAAGPAPATNERMRLWVDRSFSVTGAGTIVTGTLTAGRIAVGDQIQIARQGELRTVAVRGLQTGGQAHSALEPVTRAAVNLRGVAATDIGRGDALLTPDAWLLTDIVDVRRVSGETYDEAPEHLTAHVGTAAIKARIRAFGADHARITLETPLPLAIGDRLVLRDPGSRIVGGAQILDIEPPALQRRGDATRRLEVLQTMSVTGDAQIEVARRGAVEEVHLRRLGISTTSVPDGVLIEQGWWTDDERCATWAQHLLTEAEALHRRDPLAIGISRAAACDLIGLPSDALLDVVARRAGLVSVDGYLRLPDRPDDLGAAEQAIVTLEKRLSTDPFLAPEAEDLAQLGLGPRELAAAERVGRLLRLGDGIVVGPKTPALAMRTLAALPQPFTTSEARLALSTTRRVVIPLLEYLDRRGWTRRLDTTHREVAR